MAEPRCSLGVGCEESGVCYAMAMGEPERCGLVEMEIANRKLTRAEAEGICETPDLCFCDGSIDWVRCGPCSLTLVADRPSPDQEAQGGRRPEGRSMV
jgi:hypothetical protein